MLKIKKTAAVAALVLCLNTVASAQISVEKCDAVFSESKVTITGNTDAAGEKILITVFVKGAGQENFAENLGWQNMLTADEAGAYTETFNMNGAGIYTVTVATAEESASVDFVYTDKDSATSAIEAVNAATDIAGTLSQYKAELGLCFAGIETEPNYSAIADSIKNVLPLSTADINATIKQLQQLSLFGYIEQNQIDNIFDYEDILEIYQIANNTIFQETFFTEEHELAATGRISGKSISGYDDFSAKIKEAMILAVVQNPNGFGNVKKVLEAHQAFIGIDTANTSDNVYKNLANKNFNSIADLKKAFTEQKTGQSGQTTPGGKPNSGGTGSTGGGKTMHIDIDPVAQENRPTSGGIDEIFTDLAGYDWAKEAITGLYSKEIVKGKATGVFAPQDNVTRAEFVKMLTAALNIQEGEGEIKFSDVAQDDWSYPYIKKAYQAGIVKGISDTEFSGDAYISRQDMAVMVCRGLEAAGRTVTGTADQQFVDDAAIAAYASESVYALKAMGVLNGDEQGRFLPTNHANRAEAAKVIYLIAQ